MDHLPVSIKCPNCASALREEDYDREKGLMKCGYCGTLLLPPKARTGPSGFQARPPVPLPSGMSISTSPDGLILSRRWWTLAVLFLIPFCLVWDSFLVGWFTTTRAVQAPLAFSLLPLVHVAVGVGLTYYCAALLVNRTRIEVTRSGVTVSHGPLPWSGWRQLVAGVIAQLYCKEIIHNGKNGPRMSYEVWVLQHDGTQSKLVGAGLDREQALYIEQQIETYLDLADRPVGGEVRR